MMMMDLIQSLTPNQQKLVFVSAIFLLYLVVIIAFAIVYFRYFSLYPSSFVFAATIAEGQRTNRLAELTQLLDHLKKIDRVLVEVLERLRDEPDRRIDPDEWELVVPSGNIEYMTVFRPAPPGVASSPSMVIRTVDNEELKDRHKWISRARWYKSHTTIETLRQDIGRERAWVSRRSAEALRMQESFRSGSPLIWRFADFLYFSTIIQSTVGLGDIQPNSTVVRAIVVLQILIGYAILIVLLNIILGWQWQTN